MALDEASAISPQEGVSPARLRAEHNSMRSAPALTAASSPAIESTQTSRHGLEALTVMQGALVGGVANSIRETLLDGPRADLS